MRRTVFNRLGCVLLKCAKDLIVFSVNWTRRYLSMGMFWLMASSYPMHLSLYRENTPISSPQTAT